MKSNEVGKTNLTLLDSPGGGIEALISSRLRELHANGENITLTVYGKGSISSGHKANLLVISSQAGRFHESLPAIACDILLIPGMASKKASSLQPSLVVSYGMSIKDSVTLSSIEKSSLVLSLQRELPTILGHSLERQDIPVSCRDHLSHEDAMAALTTLLILGISPAHL